MKLSQLFIVSAFSLLFLVFSALTNAQDTLIINALSYDSTTRQVMVPFPEEGNFRKVEMLYSMRCHDNAVGNGAVGCREWDYHCNTVITVPERVDSLRTSHPSCVVSDWEGSIFYGTNEVTYEELTFEAQYGTISSSSSTTLGSATTSLNLEADSPQHMTYVYTSEELNAAGISAGDISGISLPIENSEAISVRHLNVKMVSTELTNTSAGNTEDLFSEATATYYNNAELTASSELIFAQPYSWDGTSNIAIQVSYQDASAPLQLSAEAIEGMGLVKQDEDRFAALAGNESWVLNNDFSSASSQITVSFWSYGDDSLPENTIAFEGVDSEGNRAINAHLPWSDATIYWDCGNEGSNYDRISKAATFDDFRNQWVNWTFIKDLNEGEMKILKNGELWTSGTGFSRQIQIAQMVVGTGANGNNGYLGYIDDFRVWKIEVPEETIKSYLYRDIDANHPYNAHLLADYRMDEVNSATIVDSSPAASQGSASYPPQTFAHGDRRVNSIAFKNLSIANERPTFSLIQSNGGNTSTVTEAFTDDLENQPNLVECYAINDGSLEQVSTSFLYETQPALAQELLEINDLVYYPKTESRYEILSFITPYGNGLNLGPDGKQFTIDMTDYLPILKGDRLMTVEGRGNNQEELDIRFRFIEGTPSREVMDIQQVWPIRKATSIWAGYGFDAIKADDVFEPRELTLDPDAGSYKIRSAVTGHGQNGEFTNQTHFLDIDGGFREFQYNVWKECADNPMYPQGGTWIYDRAGWCPGMETDVNEFELSDWVVPGQTIMLDYGMTVSTLSSADYRINNQLVTYGPYNFSNDAEILTVKRPTSQYEYERFNPACNTPLIIVKNSGGENITSMDFSYGLVDGAQMTHTWTGLIFPEQELEIELPIFSHSVWGENTVANFAVEITGVNGTADENMDNNSYQTTYNPVHIFERNFRVALRTNAAGTDSRYIIYDSNGDPVVNQGGLAANTEYLDIIDLPGGCYTFVLSDLSDNGLSFWAESGFGMGYVRLDEMSDAETLQSVVWQPNPDFGGDLYFEFMVRGTTSTADIEDTSVISIAPVPANQQVSVSWEHERSTTAQVMLHDFSGRQIYTTQVDSGQSVTIPTDNLNPGQYLMRIEHEHGSKSEWISVMR